jgi:hypothetical protein
LADLTKDLGKIPHISQYIMLSLLLNVHMEHIQCTGIVFKGFFNGTIKRDHRAILHSVSGETLQN